MTKANKANFEMKPLAKRDLAELSRSRRDGNITVSFYLGVSVNRSVGFNFASEANSLIHRGLEELKKNKSYSKSDRKKIEEIVKKLKKRIKFLKLPGDTRSVAAFFDTGETERVYRLPIYLPSEFVVETDPFIHPLARAVEKFPYYLAVAADRDKAVFSRIWLGEIEGESEAISSDVPQRINAARAGWKGLDGTRIERHIEEHVNRHLEKIASKIEDYFRNGKFDYMVIGAHEDLTARLIKLLDAKSSQKLIGAYHLPHFNSRAVEEKSLAIISDHEKKQEEKIADALLEGVNIRTWLAVVGTGSVIKNLYRHNVNLLVVGRNYEEAGYLCSQCHFVSSNAKDCPKDGTKATKVSDLAGAIIEEAIKRKVAVKHLFYDHKEFDKFGIGAFLNYSRR